MTGHEGVLAMCQVEYEVLTGQDLHTMRINGHCPTGREAKRVLTQPACKLQNSVSYFWSRFMSYFLASPA